MRFSLRRPPLLGPALDRSLSARLQWSPETLQEHVQGELSRRLALASIVPAYADMDLGTPGADPVQRLARAPLLPRATLAAAPRSFSDPRWGRPLLRPARTSGSTGEPLTVYRDPVSVLIEHAFLRRQLRAHGWDPSWRSLALRAEGPREPSRSPIGRSHGRQEWQVAASRLDEAGTRAVLELGRERGIALVRAYPSALLELARRIEVHGLHGELKRWPLRLLHVSSETLTPATKLRLERVFGVPVAEQYGQAERALLIQTCPEGSRHLMLDYGWGEVVDGEWVGTGLFGGGAVLLRYQTGDLAGDVKPGSPIADSSHCTCCWPFPIVGPIDGRQDAVIRTPEGRRVGRIGPALRAVEGLARAQVEQQGDLLRLRFAALDPADEATVGGALQQAVSQLLGSSSMRFELLPGEPPLRDRGGKVRAVLSEGPPPSGEVAELP